MKKIVLLFVCTALCAAFLIGCMPAAEPQGTSIVVKVGEITPGMKVDDIWAGITVNGKGESCMVEWWYYTDDDTSRPLIITADITEDFRGYVDISYYLPEGSTLDDTAITVDAVSAVSYETTEGAYPSDTQLHRCTRINFDLSANE